MKWILTSLLLGATMLGSTAAAWEMRVCAPPASPPASTRDGAGFDNQIARILADEMDAELTFEWFVLNNQTVGYEVNAGACDVVMGVADGAGGLISTIAYYQTPYVMVFRADGPELSGALDDPALEGLRLATYPNGLTDQALRQYGHGDQLVTVTPDPADLRYDFSTPILQKLLAGELDAALLEGPLAGNFVSQHADELRLAPVSPLIIPPLTQLYRTATIAVRAGDAALRDQLNIALATRWDDVQAVLAGYGVPTIPQPAPRLPAAPQPDAVIGLVLPTTSATPSATDPAARAARDGALLGDDMGALASGLTVHLREASAPGADAARRAAERLVELDGAAVLVGGVGDGQAQNIGAVAEESGTLFLSLDPSVTGESTFAVAPRTGDYVSRLLSVTGPQDWFVVRDAETDWLEPLLTEAGGQLAGELVVEPPHLVYYADLPLVAESGATAVLLLGEFAEQEQFLAQSSLLLPDIPVHSVADLPFQGREHLLRLRSVAPAQAGLPRPAAWEATADSATDLSERFSGRFGRPMDPVAWTAWAALMIAHQALDSGQDPVSYLESGVTFSLAKDQEATFDPDTHFLQQDVSLVSIDPDAPWGLTALEQLELARPWQP